MRAWEIKRQAALVEWAERVRACRSSGLSVTAWCEEEGIERKTYYRWEREVLKLAGENRMQGREVEFAQLAPGAQVRGEEKAEAKIRVRVGRATVEVYPGADMETVGALCRVLSDAE